ncbi:MAG: CDP-alcohol phosphatidyltransferase family protein [Rhodospirillaceae bacterium]|nr:CDP-alcohol phosphatidyltransferase family protein [Rhodospirillaceae bacterium]
MSIPNFISMLRIVSVPFMVWLMLEGLYLGAFWLFAAAGVSDALDGFIAKVFHMETELGKYLDAIADKMLLVAVFVTMGAEGLIPNWMVILVVFRDLMIVGGALLFETLTGALKVKPLMISKINTTMQIVYAGVVLGAAGYKLDLVGFLDVLLALTAVMTVLSGISYIVGWSGRWSDGAGEEN